MNLEKRLLIKGVESEPFSTCHIYGGKRIFSWEEQFGLPFAEVQQGHPNRTCKIYSVPYGHITQGEMLKSIFGERGFDELGNIAKVTSTFGEQSRFWSCQSIRNLLMRDFAGEEVECFHRNWKYFPIETKNGELGFVAGYADWGHWGQSWEFRYQPFAPSEKLCDGSRVFIFER